jgi:MYXO-CTERM domain-containing protein
MYLIINGYSESTVYVVWNVGKTVPINFETADLGAGNVVTFNAYKGTCDSLPNSPVYSNTFYQELFSVPIADLIIYADPVSHGLAVYAERERDGALSPCQMIYFVRFGEEPPTATPTFPPSPSVTPTAPADAPSATSTTGVTGLPQTGSGSGSPPALPTIILGAAMAVLVTAFGIQRRRHRRAGR